MTKQVRICEDPGLYSFSEAELLDPTVSMTVHLEEMYYDKNAAVCGYIYSHGIFKFFANANFSSTYASTEELNVRYDEASIFPSEIIGEFVDIANKEDFFRSLATSMLSDKKSVPILTGTKTRNHKRVPKLLEIRYVVQNRGTYACLGVSFSSFERD